MARRAASSPKKRTGPAETASFELLEPATPPAPRRGRKGKPDATDPADTAEAMLPGVETPSIEAPPAEAAPEAPKARRGRKPKPSPEPVEADGPDEMAAAPPGDAAEQTDMLADDAAPSPAQDMPAPQAEASPAPADASAASWNADSGTATFDWPAIERVAAAGGPNQAMARLLLAARAEGANSRWPF